MLPNIEVQGVQVAAVRGGAHLFGPKPLGPQLPLQGTHGHVAGVAGGTVLHPDEVTGPVGGIEDWDDLVGEDVPILAAIQGAVDPHPGEGLSIATDKAKRYGIAWEFGSDRVPVGGIHSLVGDGDGSVVPPVQVLLEEKVLLVRKDQDLASSLPLEFVEHGPAHLQPLLALGGGQLLAPDHSLALQPQVLLDLPPNDVLWHRELPGQALD